MYAPHERADVGDRPMTEIDHYHETCTKFEPDAVRDRAAPAACA